jgi:hypothetical protein
MARPAATTDARLLGQWAGPGFWTTINQLIQSVAAKYFLLPLAAELCYKESN